MRRQVQLLALAGSAGLLLGALAFQYIGGMAPCALCIWQRWPHVVALLGTGALVWPTPVLALVGAGGLRHPARLAYTIPGLNAVGGKGRQAALRGKPVGDERAGFAGPDHGRARRAV